MKCILIFSAGLFLFSSCKQTVANREAANQELLERDKSWSQKVTEVGFQRVMGEFYADDLVSMSPGRMPIIGRAALEKYMAEHPDTSTSFSWTPKKAEVAESGDLGYTWGQWKYKGHKWSGEDTVFFGVYSTFWKRQTDGKWRVVLDQSNNTPKP